MTTEELREMKRDFDIRRNSLETAQEYLLPRSEAVDGLLIVHDDDLRNLRADINELRRHMGLSDPARLFPVRRAA